MRFAALIRGGNWNNGARAGVFSMNLNNSPSNTNNNIGLRGARNLSWPKPIFYGRLASPERSERLLKVPLPAQATCSFESEPESPFLRVKDRWGGGGRKEKRLGPLIKTRGRGGKT